MPKMTTEFKNTTQSVKKPKRSELLRTVPYEKGFHFFTENEKYTGVTAITLSEFSEKLQKVPVESILFHFQRDDFQKWFRNVLCDEELADRLDQVKKWPSWSSDENMRKELLKTVQKRIAELSQSQETG